MIKTKTNISAKTNTGSRRKVDIIAGESGPYTSGDILDANATKQLVDNVADRVGAIMDMAPENFDTLKEVADAITSKANTADLATVATTGSYNDLIGKPTIPNVAVVNLEAEDLNMSTSPYTITNQNKISQICDLIEAETVVTGVVSLGANIYPVPALTFYILVPVYNGADLTNVNLVATSFAFSNGFMGQTIVGAAADVTSRYVTLEQ